MVDGKGGKILVVEDEPGVAVLQQRCLRRAGYDVVHAENAAAAFALVRAGDIELVLMDYHLPGERTGLDVFSDFVSAGFEVPVIIVTGLSNEATVVKALRAGVRDFVTKSVEYLDYLPEAVANVLKHVRTEAQLKKTEEQLRQKQKLEAVGELAGGVAHEFNNLLQAIVGYTKFAQAALAPDSQAHEDLQQTLKAAARATTITRQLLTLGRQHALQRTQVNLNEVVSDLIAMLRPLLPEDIVVNAQLDDHLDLVFADEGQLQQVLLNLSINARDAMPLGGELVLRSENVQVAKSAGDLGEMSPGNYVLVSVADTGSGIPADVKAHIFEPFFTTKDVGKGTGLGLAVVYGIVRQHDGSIQVLSEPGKGAEFRIYLPSQSAAVTTQAEIDVGVAPVGGSETILVAEDDPAVRDLLVRVLGGAGYHTLVVRDGEEAVETFVEHAESISLVLLDSVMPKMSGHAAYHCMRKLKPEVRAVFCSGHDPERSESERLGNQGLPLVEKPFDTNVLLETIRSALDTHPLVSA